MYIISRLREFLLPLVLSLCVLMCTAEIFSSVSKMKTLPSLEKQLLHKFEDFLKSVPDDEVTRTMKGKVRRLQKQARQAMEDVTLIENPLHAFRLIRRLVKQWLAVFPHQGHLLTAPGDRLTVFLNSTRDWINKQQFWPSAIDLSGAAMAIVRLHHLYDLSYDSILQGRFLNMTSVPMTSVELSYVTKAAVKLGFICDAKELFSALEARSEGRKGTSLQRLREKVSNLVVGFSSECDHNSTFTIPPFQSLANTPEQNRRDVVRSLYHQMCRKSMQEAIVYGSGTRCYWHSTYIPYLRFKADLVNHDPLIVAFHDVISNEEMREMKDLSFGQVGSRMVCQHIGKQFALHHISRALHRRVIPGRCLKAHARSLCAGEVLKYVQISPSTLAVAQVAPEQHLVRVSQNAWLFDSSPVVSRVSQRVQLITGLSTRILPKDTHAEPYQVLNYGLGGVYGPHEDSVRVPRQRGNENTPLLRNSGDRTATWMYYLSDVSLGGATVFPLLGAGVRPQKGTAVFWYNLKRSGQGDVRMVHAGCPVLYGDKWIANKWLREAGNVFTRPCLLEPSL